MAAKNSAGKLKGPKQPARTPLRDERERRALAELAAAYDDPAVEQLRGAAVGAVLRLPASGSARAGRRRRLRAVCALADALRDRAPSFARLEPDLDRRVFGLVLAEAIFSVHPTCDQAVVADLVRAIAPGTLSPDGAPRRTEVMTADEFAAAYAKARETVTAARGKATQVAIADEMAMSKDTLYRLRKDFKIA